MMRRVVLSFWISLDGYSCDEGTELYRVMQEMPDDEQQDEYFVNRLRQVGTHIMGRVTYEGMADFWPKFDNPVAGAMNDNSQGGLLQNVAVRRLARIPDRQR